ncbi:interleukin-10 [Engraulis encrasicolus]|uniref:interleukin-10 n=1 Tax=Engraulis encrasicolus TaxID=184585 RepID=UPI002FD1702A
MLSSSTSHLVLGSLLLLAFSCAVFGAKVDCSNRCCTFVENAAGKLKNLRVLFRQIRSYYEDNDDLESVLLDDGVLQQFKTRYGCHVVNDVLRFYHDNVLPAATNDTQKSEEFKTKIDSIGQLLKTLMRDILHCRNYFSCIEPFSINKMMNSYNGMEKKGMFKAMGELDILFNYLEDYLVSKRRT